jgi:medium-chain acyl-CoA synthetase
VAAIRADVILCPATTLLVDNDIQFRCQKTKATTFVGDATSIEKMLKVRSQCPALRTVIQVGGSGGGGVVEYSSAMANIPNEVVFPPRPRNWNTPALIYFTSGTAGPPKMVLHNQISYPLGKSA